jgi:nucleotide-binding universal stress UspA family protein
MTDGNRNGPIVFAYDGSEQAKASIGEAGRQLGPGRDAIVLTVWQPIATLPFGGAASNVELEETMEREAAKVAAEGARFAASVGFAARPLTAPGGPIWRQIIDTADDHDASLVVMGSHGRTGVALALLGSVAESVARHTDRAVMIVPAHHDGNGA